MSAAFASTHKDTISPSAAEEIVSLIERFCWCMGAARTSARSNEILGAIAEVRLAKTTATFFTNMSTVNQRAWIDDLISRAAAPVNSAPYVCLLDTGINRGHPLLAAVTHDNDIHCYDPNWGPADQIGHGTPMAGLAVYGDLTEALAGGQNVQFTHRIESVKLINATSPHDKELYGAVTSEVRQPCGSNARPNAESIAWLSRPQMTAIVDGLLHGPLPSML